MSNDLFSVSFSESLNCLFAPSSPSTNSVSSTSDDDLSSDDDHDTNNHNNNDSSIVSNNNNNNHDAMQIHHADDFSVASINQSGVTQITSTFSVSSILYSLFENLSSVASLDSKDFRADGVYKRHAPNLVRLNNVLSTAKFYPFYANQSDANNDIRTIIVEVPIVIIRKQDFQETTAPSFVYSTVNQTNHSLCNISRTLAEYSLLPTKSSQKLPNYQSAEQCDILIVCDWKKGDKQFKSVLNKHYTPSMVRKALIIFDKQIQTPKIRGKCDFRPRADIRAIYSVNQNYSADEIYARIQQNNEQQIIDGRPCSACHQQKYYLSAAGYQCVRCQRCALADDFFPSSKPSTPVPLTSDDDSSDDEKKVRGKKRRRSDDSQPTKKQAKTINAEINPIITVTQPSITQPSLDINNHQQQYIDNNNNYINELDIDIPHNQMLPSLEDFGSTSSHSFSSLTALANDRPLNNVLFFEPNYPSYFSEPSSSFEDNLSSSSYLDNFSSNVDYFF